MINTLITGVIIVGLLYLLARYIIWPYLQGEYKLDDEKVQIYVPVITAILLGILAIATVMV